MAFLAPLFLAGLAALALPVLLHLRQNRPKQTVAFSSLMFLEASPPITRRRSRLEEVFLLVLRCLALGLLILAFSRPFFPAKDETPAAAYDSVTHFILIDASGSMRGEPFERAVLTARELIDGLPGDDAIALATFSDRLRILLGPERARELAGGARKATVLGLLDEADAGWHATRLDAVLPAAASAAGEDGSVKIHLIGDLQKGAILDRLRGEAWPDAFQIVLHPIDPPETWTNAGIRIVPTEQETRRIRVSNSEGSVNSDFTLSWSGSDEKATVSVPPGESAIFEAPPGVPAEGKVTLEGDDFTFDNEAAWTTPTRPVAKIWSTDPAEITDATESAYFLDRAMQATPDYSVEIVAEVPADPPALIVTSGLLEEEDIIALRRIIGAGANALFTLRDPSSATALAKILELPAAEAAEARVTDHARLGEIDFRSVVFAPFADPRYSDFSGIRFWKYRILPAELTAPANVFARFDSGDPAWLAYPIGEGTLHVLTTTWRPADSQLALTTKFPPLLHSLLGVSNSQRGVHLVGAPLSLPPEISSVTLPDGSSVETPFTPEAPGIHQAGDYRFVVQMDPAESELTPLPETELRAIGLPLDAPPTTPETTVITAALSNAEQESRQRVAWWLLAAASLFFIAETAWAALSGRRQLPATP